MTSTQDTSRGLPLPADLRTADVRGTRLAYRERGSGEPVVFVHGSINDLATWDRQLPAVGATHRAIAYSRRYAWPNADLPAGEKDVMEPHVEDLLAFLRAVGAYPAHLVGNSWGAVICLLAAVREPGAIRSLTLEEPPLIPVVIGAPPSPARILASLVRHPLVTMAVLRFGGGTLRKAGKMIDAGDVEESVWTFARGVLGERALEKLSPEFRAHMLANISTHVGQFRADGGFVPLTAAQIRSITAPALVVAGANSPPFLRRLAALLATLLPNSRAVEIPDASHVMHYENADALNAALLAFLGEHATRSEGSAV